MSSHDIARMHIRHSPAYEGNGSVSGGSRYPSKPPMSPHHGPQHIDRERSTEFQSLPPVLPPPRPSSQASVDSERRLSRTTLGSVHSILNPPQDNDLESRGRRRSAAQMEADSNDFLPPHDAQVSRPSSSGGVQGELSPPGFQGSSKRRITVFTSNVPRNTTTNRVITESVDGTRTSGTIDARGTPFLSSSTSVHTSIEGRTAGPQLPPISSQIGPRQSFSSHSQAPTPPIEHALPRRRSVSILQGGAPSIASTRASPAPSHSSYSRSGQASPSYSLPPSSGPTPPGSFSLAPSPVGVPLNSIPPVSLDMDGPHGMQHIPVISANHSNFELFSINTGRGRVALPVEVMVASKQADEKRKRNAGASARFRQRRKEKEREANNTIDKLRDELHQMTRNCEYYKSERDRYLGVLKTSPGWENHLPRSPSPVMRPPQPRSESADGVTPSSPQSGSNSDHSRPGENDRNTRRRTDTYSLPMPSPTGSVGTPGGYQSPFPPFSPGSSRPQSLQHPPFSPTTLDPHNSHHRLSIGESSMGPKSAYGPPWPAHAAQPGHS